MEQIKVLLADDHRMMREGLKSLLEQSDTVQVIGEAQDGLLAVEMAINLHPDVVVMDIAMPGLNGIEATQLITSQNLSIKVIILTMYETEEYIIEILKAGATCYVTKDAAGDDLLKAIHAAAKGEVFIQSSFAAKIISRQINQSVAMENKVALTTREKQILRLIINGMNNKEVALQLHLSMNTVRTHRANIMDKLDVHNSAELISKAIHLRLL